MTIVYSRLQASEASYKEKISKELDEDNNGLLFDFKNNNTDNDNIINVEYSGKLIALVEKKGNDYIIERVAGTPQPSEPTQEMEHGGDVIRLAPKKDNIIRVDFG